MKLLNLYKKYLKTNQNGVTMIEYALIAALVSIIAVATLRTLGTDINAIFQRIVTAVGGA